MTNPYESYYVTKHSDLNGKAHKLLRQQGWRREITDTLLQQQDDEVTVDSIKHILSTVPSEKKPNDDRRFNFFITLLPKNIRAKATMLMHYIDKLVRITDEGIVQYDDGSYGSNIIDLLKYFCSSGYLNMPKPIDADKLETLLKETGAPQSAFGKRTQRNTPNQWKNYK